MAGAEVVQVYLRVPWRDSPASDSSGSRKYSWSRGASEPVSITIDPAATNHPFNVWDYCTQGFATKPGEYTVFVGNSADNTPHTATLTVV